MTIRELDTVLSRLRRERQDGTFAEFCARTFESSSIPGENLSRARHYLVHLDRVLAILSGEIISDNGGEASLTAIKMALQDTHDYDGMPGDLTAAAEYLAGRAGKQIAGSGVEALPGNVAMSIGIQCYGAVLTDARLRADEFRELFVCSWCRFYAGI